MRVGGGHGIAFFLGRKALGGKSRPDASGCTCYYCYMHSAQKNNPHLPKTTCMYVCMYVQYMHSILTDYSTTALLEYLCRYRFKHPHK